MTNNERDYAQVLSIYTQAQAIEDGVLVKVGAIKGIPIVFTAALFEGYSDVWARKGLVYRGLRLLAKPNEEDTDNMHLRVIEEGIIWVIWDGDGITFLKPSDY